MVVLTVSNSHLRMFHYLSHEILYFVTSWDRSLFLSLLRLLLMTTMPVTNDNHPLLLFGRIFQIKKIRFLHVLLNLSSCLFPEF